MKEPSIYNELKIVAQYKVAQGHLKEKTGVFPIEKYHCKKEYIFPIVVGAKCYGGPPKREATMYSQNVGSRTLLFLFVMIFPFLCSYLFASSYKVLLPEIPDKLNYEGFNYAHSFFVLRQLHETTFKNVTLTKYESELVEKLKVKLNHKDFSFCIKENVKFSNGKILSNSIYKENLLRFEKVRVLKYSIKAVELIGSKCINVKFSQSYKKFIFDLSAETAVIVYPPSFDKEILIGISPYTISKMNKNELVLTLESHVKNKPYITGIYFYRWHPAQKERSKIGYNLNQIHDFNQIPGISEEIAQQKLKQIKVPMFGMSLVTFIFNIQDFKLRDLLWNCLTLSQIQTLYPEKKFINLKAYLPFGILGGEKGSINQKCPNNMILNKRKILIITYRKDKLEKLSETLGKLLKPLSISPEIKALDINQFSKSLANRSYDVAMTGLELHNIDYMRNFSIFYSRSKDRITKVSNSVIDKNLPQFHTLRSYDQKETVLKRMSRSLIFNRQLLILGQIWNNYHFPKNILINPQKSMNANYQIKFLKEIKE